ncbi:MULTISPECIES: formate/nitrite transporter family protein [unclassified Enterococcus]|uniref:formate/nitrite transporter family protein n=1 Tax=unclassified Enterococcus TaxID=2608891 RepID=UPI001CE13859|nr:MULTISPECIES: formate/nitrite transporter family protein [unclassified Enterococcus]MCA5011730.1 formate/nitrite transporter family protein [Enterococcus sp. S23]MCA5014828.1 formate/nitrite transporter family protein [Enterococcus sp. S22(2020)]
MDFDSSQEVVSSLGDKAKAKTKLSFVRLSILGIMAGSFIALGYLSFVRITGTVPETWGSFATFLGGCLFPIGLVALTFVGGELATGNMMVMTLGLMQKKITKKDVIYNWLIVLITNCLGGFLVAFFFGHIVGLTEGAFLEKTLSVAQAKINDTPLVAFVSGIGCNIFVCLAVYLGAMGKTYLGKIFGLWFPVMVFVVCGFQHVVANAFIIPAAIFSNASNIQWSEYLINTVVVFFGNAVGGSLFLAVPLMFVTTEKKEAEELSVGGVYEKT